LRLQIGPDGIKKVDTTMAERLTLSNRRLQKLFSGLRNLDGVSNEAGKIERFDFEDGVSWNISKNTVLVERALEPYERERKKLLGKHGIVEGVNHTVNEENAPKYAKFMEDIEGLKDKTIEVSGLLMLKLADLNKGGKIPPSVKADLFDLIKE
jgi:hypothetical protein